MVCDRPSEIHLEQVRPRGWNSHQLHNENGPAIAWRDGWAIYSVHGVRIPAWVIEQPERITPEAILAESNAEVRRVMIDKYGWDRFADHRGMELIDTCDDPGNPDSMILLYDLPPEMRNVLGVPVRLILVTNGSPDPRTGLRRQYGLTVPVQMTRAIDAAAWCAGTDAKTYARTARRT